MNSSSIGVSSTFFQKVSKLLTSSSYGINSSVIIPTFTVATKTNHASIKVKSSVVVERKEQVFIFVLVPVMIVILAVVLGVVWYKLIRYVFNFHFKTLHEIAFSLHQKRNPFFENLPIRKDFSSLYTSNNVLERSVGQTLQSRSLLKRK